MVTRAQRARGVATLLFRDGLIEFLDHDVVMAIQLLAKLCQQLIVRRGAGRLNAIESRNAHHHLFERGGVLAIEEIGETSGQQNGD